MFIVVTKEVAQTYGTARDQLIRPIIGRHIAAAKSLPLADTLYHYTSVVGLKGMIDDGALWASSLAYCNDREEYFFGIRKCLEFLSSMPPPSDRTHQEVLERIQAKLPMHANEWFFACCLTVEGDQLSQWRGYGDMGSGFAVGLDKASIMSGFTRTDASVDLYPVVYEDTAQKEWIAAVLDGMTSSVIRSLEGSVSEDDIRSIVRVVEMEVTTASISFKNPGFHEEREFRLVAGPSPFSMIPTNAVSIRTSGTRLVPYMELLCQDQRVSYEPDVTLGPLLPIKQIVIGPKQNFQQASNSVTILLDNRGYDTSKIEITASAIPFV